MEISNSRCSFLFWGVLCFPSAILLAPRYPGYDPLFGQHSICDLLLRLFGYGFLCFNRCPFGAIIDNLDESKCCWKLAVSQRLKVGQVWGINWQLYWRNTIKIINSLGKEWFNFQQITWKVKRIWAADGMLSFKSIKFIWKSYIILKKWIDFAWLYICNTNSQSASWPVNFSKLNSGIIWPLFYFKFLAILSFKTFGHSVITASHSLQLQIVVADVET